MRMKQFLKTSKAFKLAFKCKAAKAQTLSTVSLELIFQFMNDIDANADDDEDLRSEGGSMRSKSFGVVIRS